MNWKPLKDTVGVPGEGFIPSEMFNEEHLNKLIARAKNRKIDPQSFLLKAGLVPINPQVALFEADAVAPVEEPKADKPKRQRKEKSQEQEFVAE